MVLVNFCQDHLLKCNATFKIDTC